MRCLFPTWWAMRGSPTSLSHHLRTACSRWGNWLLAGILLCQYRTDHRASEADPSAGNGGSRSVLISGDRIAYECVPDRLCQSLRCRDLVPSAAGTLWHCNDFLCDGSHTSPEILKAQLLSKLRIVYVPICHQRYRRARHFIVFYITAYRISDAGSFGICGEPYCNFISVVYHFAVHSSHPAGDSFLVRSLHKKDGRGEPRKRREKILP